MYLYKLLCSLECLKCLTEASEGRRGLIWAYSWWVEYVLVGKT